MNPSEGSELCSRFHVPYLCGAWRPWQAQLFLQLSRPLAASIPLHPLQWMQHPGAIPIHPLQRLWIPPVVTVLLPKGQSRCLSLASGPLSEPYVMLSLSLSSAAAKPKSCCAL